MPHWTTWHPYTPPARRAGTDAATPTNAQDWLEWQAAWWAPWQYAWQSWWQMWGIAIPGLLPAGVTPERLQSYAPGTPSAADGAQAPSPALRESEASEDDIAPARVVRGGARAAGGRRAGPPRRTGS